MNDIMHHKIIKIPPNPKYSGQEIETMTQRLIGTKEKIGRDWQAS